MTSGHAILPAIILGIKGPIRFGLFTRLKLLKSANFKIDYRKLGDNLYAGHFRICYLYIYSTCNGDTINLITGRSILVGASTMVLIFVRTSTDLVTCVGVRTRTGRTKAMPLLRSLRNNGTAFVLYIYLRY